MNAKFIRLLAIISISFISFFIANHTYAQTTPFEDGMAARLDSLIHAPLVPTAGSYAKLSPNDAMQGIMTPSGWGGYGTYVFGGLSGTYPEQYKDHKADLIGSIGFCIGNPDKYVNVAASLNITDVHRFTDFSGNLIVSRQLSTGNSISAGALQVFASAAHSDAPDPTFYFAYSHAVQWAKSATPGCSALSYTIGIGNGRFLDKSPYDISSGKGKYGTAVFGSVSYEVFKHANLSAEWSGENLGFSLGLRPFKNAFSVGVGVANLTRYSGDRTSMVFGIGIPLALPK